jgi:hypothetical protein
MNIKNNISSWNKMHRGAVSLVAILALIGVLGFTIFPKYLISFDEEAVIKVVQVNLDSIAGRKDYSTHLEFYGTLFNFAEGALHKTEEILFKPSAGGEASEMIYRIVQKHRFNFFLSLITYGAVAGLVAILAGLEFAWLGPLVLLLIPRFLGHSFFNSKDIPMAVMFTLGTLLGAWLINHYSRQQSQLSVGRNRTTVYSVLYGILVGCAAGARIDSCVLALFVPLVDILLRLQRKESLKQILGFGQFYAVMLLTSLLSIFVLYPASWANPIGWYIEAFKFYYQEDWPHTVLFNGSFIPAKTVPWQYIPTWLVITIPVALLVLFVVGLILATWKYRQFSVIQRACLLLVGLQIFGLPGFAMLWQGTMYDELRQMLYILPAIAAIAAAAIAWLYQMLRPRMAKLALVAGLIVLALPIGVDMVQLHPYEYVYFNRAFGGLPSASGRFETDYYGLSMPEAVTWLNQHRDPTLPLVSTEPMIAANHLADEELTVISYDEFTPQDSPFYYMSIPRWKWEQRLADCPVVYGVTRQKTPLAVVKQCTGR